MYEIVLSCEDVGRHEHMAVTSRHMDARMGMWLQMYRIMKRFGDDIEMRETLWLDLQGALCEGVEWVHMQPDHYEGLSSLPPSLFGRRRDHS